MKRFALAALLIVLLAVPGLTGETRYISDLMEITLRTGPGTGRKIIAMLPSNLKVEVLSENGQWTKVRTPEGKEGWVVSRFLTTETPKSIKLDRLQKKYDELRQRAETLAKENTELKAKNEELSTQLAEKTRAFDELNKTYQTLKTESAEFLAVKEKYEKTASRLAEQTSKAERLESELSKLEFHQNIRWFLSGAGVLLVGFIIGFSAKRQRRRSSLL